MTIALDITPSAHLPVSVARQEQIIAAINAALEAEPRQGFCLMGPPGTGKTEMIQAIRRWVMNNRGPYPKYPYPMMSDVITLAEWQEANLEASRGGKLTSNMAIISAKYIRDKAESNEQGLRFKNNIQTLHYFIDEFDSQPTVSEFSISKLQTFINACYLYAPRSRQGNMGDFVQLVIAMNKSWTEFEAAYGVHIARRIAEMCVRIDFGRADVVQPPPTQAVSDEPDEPDQLDQFEDVREVEKKLSPIEEAIRWEREEEMRQELDEGY